MSRRCARLFVVLSLFWAFFTPCVAWANELTLYFYPSPGLDWSTPKALGHSAVSNTLSGAPHAIGHVSIEVACDDGSGLLAGATGAEADYTEDLVRNQGYGLGLLFHTFPDGRLYSRAEIEAELPDLYARGALTFARFKISNDACARLVRYHREYLANGYDHSYGLANRPLFREGAGCTAFGVSFLEVAGILEPAIERSFARAYYVPTTWIGGPLTGNFIPVRRFFNPLFPSHWAGPGEASFFIHFYDADLMDRWVRSLHAGVGALPRDLPLTGYLRRGNALGVDFDATGLAVPRGSIWKI